MNKADLLWIPPTSDYNLHKTWLKVFSSITSFPLIVIVIVIVIIIVIVIVTVWIQGNFEKLTRDELVIIEAENVLQPAAIKKVVLMTMLSQ